MALKNKFGDDVIIHWHDRKRWCGLPLSFTRYYIVEKPGQWIKLYCDIGFFSSKIEEIQLYRMDDVSLHQNLLNKIFGVGTIDIKSDDKSMPEFKVLRIKKPYQVYDLLSTLIVKDRKAKNFRWGEYSD